MKLASAGTAFAAVAEISAAGYCLAAQPQGGSLQATLIAHCLAAVICAATAARFRTPSFLFYVVPALLLPVGGVLTVWATSYILRSPVGAPQDDAAPFETVSVARSSESPAALMEPLAGTLRQLPLNDIQSLASGLRSARPASSAAAVLQYLQQHEDTEVRFRAQGSVTRAIRPAEELLKQLSEHETLTSSQCHAAADACMDLAEWTPATGANKVALLQNAISYLDSAESSIPQLARLTRAQLASRHTDGAATSLENLRVAGASDQLCDPLQAELLYQQGDWQKLAQHCATLPSTTSDISSTARFWRTAMTTG
jgi:hypothetical protein